MSDIRHFFTPDEPPAREVRPAVPAPDPTRRTLDAILEDFRRVHLAQQLRLERF